MTAPTAPQRRAAWRRAARHIAPQPGPQTRFLSTAADVCIYGGAAGAGKSYGLLMNPLRHVSKTRFGAVCFRRTLKQVTNEGGLWDTASTLYPLLGATPRVSSYEFLWPTTQSSVRFGHLEHDKNVLDWQGSQIPAMLFDEVTHFSAYQFWYMLSRNRVGNDTAVVRPYVRATCNPDPDSFVAELIAWWIGDDGYPLLERSGVLRWFIRVADELHWASDPAELHQRFGYGEDVQPRSFTFIPAKLDDNQILQKLDPTYRANLLALTLIERERLLHGNWKIRASGGVIFNRANFKVMPFAEERRITSVRWVRAWDKAATNAAGDWTVGVLMAELELKDTPGKVYWVVDVIREQLGTHEREALIYKTAVADGYHVEIAMEQEPGSSGVDAVNLSINNLAGWDARGYRSSGSKADRAQPYAAQVEAGRVYLLPAPWNEPYLQELHAFPTKGVNDDQVDASTLAFKVLTSPREWSTSHFPL